MRAKIVMPAPSMALESRSSVGANAWRLVSSTVSGGAAAAPSDIATMVMANGAWSARRCSVFKIRFSMLVSFLAARAEEANLIVHSEQKWGQSRINRNIVKFPNNSTLTPLVLQVFASDTTGGSVNVTGILQSFQL